jgi:hypothetical protein
LNFVMSFEFVNPYPTPCLLISIKFLGGWATPEGVWYYQLEIAAVTNKLPSRAPYLSFEGGFP